MTRRPSKPQAVEPRPQLDLTTTLAAIILAIANLALLGDLLVRGPSPAHVVLLAITLTPESVALVSHARRVTASR